MALFVLQHDTDQMARRLGSIRRFGQPAVGGDQPGLGGEVVIEVCLWSYPLAFHPLFVTVTYGCTL